jgi:hypothetical protein
MMPSPPEIACSKPEPAGTVDFRILSAEVPADLDAWLRIWNQWPDREILAHPEFVRMFAPPGGEVLAAVRITDQGGILYPFILRPLGSEAWCPAGQRGCDLTTPYGYGGPYAWGAVAPEAAEFWAHFERWARSRDVVSAFARLSVFPDQLLPFDGEIAYNCPNVVRSLDLSEEAMWNDYAPKVRQNVRRARSRGCEFRIDPDGDRLDEFLNVYTATMTRQNALSQYFFPRAFFESFVKKLKGHCSFFHVLLADRVVSSELVLLSQQHAYFFLGGTLAEAFDARPSDFLQHETFRWCRSLGKRALVLGGGYRGSEGLLKYKKAFAPGGEVPFRIGMKTYDPAATARLVEARLRWEAARGISWYPEPGYFPPYRSPVEEGASRPAPVEGGVESTMQTPS